MSRHIWSGIWSQWIAPILLGLAIPAALGFVCIAAWEGWWMP